MTDIDFPSHIVHLDVLNDMVKNYQFIYLTKSDIERILPFVRKSQEVETLLSNFVLEHYNSIDKNERSLSGTIIERFRPLRGFLNVTLMGESDQIDNLNKSIKLLHDHIVYTIETYDSTGISLPHPKPIVNKSASVVNKPKKVVNEAKKATNKCEIDKNSTSEGGEWDKQYDDVFESSLDPHKIFEVLEDKSDPRVTDDYPRFFVFFRVLLYIGWIKNHQKKFLQWANCHWKRNWTYKYNFKFANNIKKELRDTDMDKWDDKTCNGSDIGNAYRNFAIKVMSALTEKVNNGKVIDRTVFYREGVADRINDGKKLSYPF